MNKVWLFTGLMLIVLVGAGFFFWRITNADKTAKTSQAMNLAGSSAELPPIDKITYKKMETAAFAMG